MTDDKKPDALAVRMTTVRDWLRVQEPEIARALPKGHDAAAFARVALNACMKNTRLLECSRQSLMLAVMEAAALGLEPNTLGLSYLVPYAGVATLIIGYKGYVQLAGRAGTMILADLVYEKEAHKATQREPERFHVKLPPAERGAEVIAAYAVGSPRGVAPHAKPAVWLWREDLDAHRARSRSWQEYVKDHGKVTPWITDEAAMQRKTCIRGLAPYLPLSPQFQRALTVDDAEPMLPEAMPFIIETPPDPQSALAEKLGGAGEEEKA